MVVSNHVQNSMGKKGCPPTETVSGSRSFFDVETTGNIVSIEEVKKRDEHTY